MRTGANPDISDISLWVRAGTEAQCSLRVNIERHNMNASVPDAAIAGKQ